MMVCSRCSSPLRHLLVAAVNLIDLFIFQPLGGIKRELAAAKKKVVMIIHMALVSDESSELLLTFGKTATDC
jgi:hypothetical protein